MSRVRIIKFRRNSNKSPTITFMAELQLLFINQNKMLKIENNHYNKFT